MSRVQICNQAEGEFYLNGISNGVKNKVMTAPPKITIVTPSYNQGRFLEKTILSVLDQGYPNLEYIVIDGGSTDESVEIIKKYADRLTYWVSEPDRGQSHAINKGFERATGEIFGWLNSDDWYHPGALQAVAEAFAANPDVGAVVGAGEMVDEEGKQLIYKSTTKVDLDFLYHWLDDFFWQPS
ncbi:MAG: glycosyltransferase, partial [Geobacteraceae bacterium]|nr:glycosyltransferase [Geobacteraceae bacterium]